MSERPDFTFEADEIERVAAGLQVRIARVVAQLRAGKTLGDEDPILVAQRCRSVAESIDRADRKVDAYVAERREAAMRRTRGL